MSRSYVKNFKQKGDNKMGKNEMLNWVNENKGKTFGNFISGQWKETSNHYEVTNPATQEILGYFADSDEGSVDEAVESAHDAFKKWSNTPGPKRAEILHKFLHLLEDNKKELAYMISAEQGKPLSESLGEAARAANETRFTIGEAYRFGGNTAPSERENVSNSVTRHPIGVIAAIAPWNFPLITPIRKIIPALAYGCTVVLKPASETPWVTTKLMELFKEAGLPEGTVNLVCGRGSKVGNPLTTHKLVQGISFTGSTPVGLSVNESASRDLKKTQLELGGKNPAVVFDYEDLNFVAEQIVGAAFACSGQRCTAISRVIVLKEKEEELVNALRQKIENLKVGPAWKEDTGMGPLVSDNQLNIVQDYLQVGKEEGASLVCGGEVLKEGEFAEGYYITPALFKGAKPEMRISQEEIFGPVLTVLSAQNEDEAIEIANSVPYGLAASVFTKDISLSQRFSKEVQSGSIHVNHGTASEAHMPFGGWKQSGHGAFSIGSSNQEFYTELKTTYVQF